MSDEKSQNPDEQRSNARRSRKDQKGRNHICGCGKRYLSYPALYTHIKTKHDGQQPEGTKRTGLNGGSRKNKQQIDQKILNQLLTWGSADNYGILKQLDESFRGRVNLKRRIREQNIGKQIYEAFSNLIKALPLSIYKKSSLDVVLAVYLLNAGQFVSQPFYEVYLDFAKWLRTCYNDHGQQIFDVLDKGYGQNKLSRTFSNEQCKYVPLIADFFIRYFVPEEQTDTNYVQVISLICYDFCLWMFEKKLTSMELMRQKQIPAINEELLKGRILKVEREQYCDQSSEIDIILNEQSEEFLNMEEDKEID